MIGSGGAAQPPAKVSEPEPSGTPGDPRLLGTTLWKHIKCGAQHTLVPPELRQDSSLGPQNVIGKVSPSLLV